MGNQSSKAKLKGFEGKYDLGGGDRAVISAIMTAVLGNLGDALSRGIFYQGAYGFKGSTEISISQHNAWTMLLPMPFSNLIGMIIHSLNGVKGKINKLGGREKHEGKKDEDGNTTVKKSGKDIIIGLKNDGKHVLIDYDKKRPVYDSWVLLLIFIPIFGHYSAWVSGASNPYKSFMVISILCIISMIMARLHTKARVCDPNLDGNEVKKFTLGNATHEAIDALLISNACYAVLVIQLFLLAGYDDFNISGIYGWVSVLVAPSKTNRIIVEGFLKFVRFIFGIAMVPYAFLETFLPGMSYGLILACTHMFLNAKLRYNEKYKKEICEKNKDIQLFSYRPPFFSKKTKNWEFFGKLIGVIIIYFFAISGLPCVSGYILENEGAQGFCPGAVMRKLDIKSKRGSYEDLRKNTGVYKNTSMLFGNTFGTQEDQKQFAEDIGSTKIAKGLSNMGQNFSDRFRGIKDSSFGRGLSSLGQSARSLGSSARDSLGRSVSSASSLTQRRNSGDIPVYQNEFRPPDIKQNNGYEMPIYPNEFRPPKFTKYNGNEIPVYLKEY